ncbi:MAG TPA: serine hydrolase domain-containing protein [Candidatus Limnocylindrales bacterium]|nr:serine hydrolase domain-containing protein [Candidatus Limnocylindrales bacterium]
MTLATPSVTSDAALTPAMEDALRRVDEIADTTHAGWKVPGVAYGVVLGNRLIHSRGLGTLRVGEDAPPTAQSVFRIASMTKSFTAATVLSLRDEGRLRLDDPIVEHVPEMAGVRLPTLDSPQITIRHLLTMSAGLPTDDPWGDRQQGLDIDAFRAFLSHGLSFVWAPGTRFEYSNTGYGILGRLITNVTGREYRDVVRERMLLPLGMTSTAYDAAAFDDDPDRVARGYLWRNDRYHDEPSDPYGALASMGGIFSTVEDLATWVSGFIDAVPARDDPDTTHPLRRATRREMQQPMVQTDFWISQRSADAEVDVDVMGYGFGLFVVDNARFGRIVSHSGGYPGFGSNMRWHQASGLGVIALTNHRYGPATPLARDLLMALLAADAAPTRHVHAESRTEAARTAIERLLASWDDELASGLFAMNVELDEPVIDRKTTVQLIRERHGALRRDPRERDESRTPFHLAWWLVGERGGRVKVEILLSPEAQPKIQTFAVTSVPDPSEGLQRAAATIVAAMTPPEGRPVAIDWPAALSVGETVDVGLAVRAMRATEARFGPISLGPVTAGDGTTRATWRLLSSRGQCDLGLDYDAANDCITALSITPVRLESPDIE